MLLCGYFSPKGWLCASDTTRRKASRKLVTRTCANREFGPSVWLRKRLPYSFDVHVGRQFHNWEEAQLRVARF
jgi:hypothetical protein